MISLFNNIQNNKERKKYFSVELCSNKNIDIEALSSIDPLFYSLTWHTQEAITENTKINEISPILLSTKLKTQNILMHLPCRYLSKQNVFDVLKIAQQKGINNIFALLGDPIGNEQNRSNDFNIAIDLVRYIRETFNNSFSIAIAVYPVSTTSTDMKYLKEKIEAGADFIITQAVFDFETFQNFYKLCRENGITIPIIPGIYVISNYNAFFKFIQICHITPPENVLNSIEIMKNNEKDLQKYGLQYAINLINDLFANHDCPIFDVHIFSLNNIKLVKQLTEKIECFHLNI